MIPRGVPYIAPVAELAQQRKAYSDAMWRQWLDATLLAYRLRFRRESRKRIVEKMANHLDIPMRLSRRVFSGRATGNEIIEYWENQSRIQKWIWSKQKVVMFDEITEWPEEDPVKVGGEAY